MSRLAACMVLFATVTTLRTSWRFSDLMSLKRRGVSRKFGRIHSASPEHTHTKMCAPTHPLQACYRLSRSRAFTPSMKSMQGRTCPSPRNRRWWDASAKLCARAPVQPSVAFYSHGAPTVRGRNSLAIATKQRGILTNTYEPELWKISPASCPRCFSSKSWRLHHTRSRPSHLIAMAAWQNTRWPVRPDA